MTDTERPTAGEMRGICSECGDVTRVRDGMCSTCHAHSAALAAAESRGYVRGLREALDVAESARVESLNASADVDEPSGYDVANSIARALTARLKEAER